MQRLAVRRFGRVNWRGLAALYQRGVQRYLTQWVESLIGPLASALLFLVIFVLARGEGDADIWPGIDTPSFVGAGLVMVAASYTAFETLAMNLLYEKIEGVIKDLLAAPLSALEILVAWLAAALTNGLITAAAVMLVMQPFVDWSFAQPLKLLVFAVLGLLLFALVGLLAGLWARTWDHYALAETLFILPLTFLSGVFYLGRDLPAFGQDLLAGNPIFYAYDGFRSGLLGRADSDPLVGAAYLLGLLALLAALAWSLLARGWRLKD
ncbi:MAG: ABC transporter permease [Pseudomonadota bacterium]